MVHALTGALQLVALLGFGYGVWCLNSLAPKRTALRAFKLKWMVSTLMIGVIIAFVFARVLNVPNLIQSTPKVLISAHDAIRTECRQHLDAGRFEEAYVTISRRTKTAELIGSQAQHLAGEVSKPSIAKLLQPLLNTLLFQTGVSISFFPCLVRLLLLLLEIKRRGSSGESDDKFQNRVRREWATFLPVMNAVTLLSLCVAPTFYFFIEPARAHRCVYTSGHFYTITCTLFTFALVITHLYRNKDYCGSSYKLLQWYFAFLVLYLAMAVVVVRETQKYYHDAIESTDGIMQAIPAMIVFVCILIVFQLITSGSRHLSAEMKKAKNIESNDDDNEIDENEPGSVAKHEELSQAPSKAKKLLGESEPRASSNKKAKSQPSIAPSKPVSLDEDDDGVIVDTPVESPAVVKAPDAPPAAVPAAPALAAPNAPPLAPPIAPSAPTAPKITAPAKKASSVPAKVDSRDELLNAIKGGARLKKVDRGAKAAPPSVLGFGLSKLAQLRVAIDGEKDEKDEANDAEWD